MEVTLHIYDVTNSGSDKTNNTIMQINKIFKDGIGLGGIFHSAVQVLGTPNLSIVACEIFNSLFCLVYLRVWMGFNLLNLVVVACDKFWLVWFWSCILILFAYLGLVLGNSGFFCFKFNVIV